MGCRMEVKNKPFATSLQCRIDVPVTSPWTSRDIAETYPWLHRNFLGTLLGRSCDIDFSGWMWLLWDVALRMEVEIKPIATSLQVQSRIDVPVTSQWTSRSEEILLRRTHDFLRTSWGHCWDILLTSSRTSWRFCREVKNQRRYDVV